jgi:hypothetical protein
MARPFRVRLKRFLKRLRTGSSDGNPGAFPTQVTDPARVRSLVERLHPVAGSAELIRLGPISDGGYLVPDDLAGIVACYSPGVSSVSGFERDCADRGMRVFLADKSVDGPAEQHPLFQFSKKFVGAFSDADFMTLDDWVSSSLADRQSDLMLQIDIEGFEYETFLATSEALLQRFRIIVAEFHNLQNLWSEPFFSLASRAFEKLLRTHACVHLHPNNCCGSAEFRDMTMPRVMEFTFQRRDRIARGGFVTTFPHPLDVDNTVKPTLPLPRGWYRGA